MIKRSIASALLFMACTIIYAQKIEVSGTVVDQIGETVIGAQVMEKGSQNGALTDIDGNFKLTVEKGAVLVHWFSTPGNPCCPQNADYLKGG